MQCTQCFSLSSCLFPTFLWHAQRHTRNPAPCCYLSSCLWASLLWLIFRSSVFEVSRCRWRSSGLTSHYWHYKLSVSVCLYLVYVCIRVCALSCSDILLRINVDTFLSFRVTLIMSGWPVTTQVYLVLSDVFHSGVHVVLFKWQSLLNCLLA